MRRHSVSLTAGLSLAFSGMLLSPAWGDARATTDKDAVVACMLEKSGPREKAVMRDMLMAALQGNKQEEQRNKTLLEDVLFDLAVTKCSISESLMNKEDFGDIGARYGEALFSVVFPDMK